MTESNDRLDRIERVLDNLVTNQLNERDARLAMREDLEILYRTIQRVTENAEVERQQLSSIIRQLAENAEADRAQAAADRAVIREMQQEVRQIWQYLDAQQRSQGNGHG